MKTPLYFKILHGYDNERKTPIDADELEKAYGLFLAGGNARGIFRAGAVESKYIQAIVPDWHRMMGWAEEYELGPDNYNELTDRGVSNAARNFLASTNEKIQYLISTKQEHLIGQNAKIPELGRPVIERREGTVKPMKELLPKKP